MSTATLEEIQDELSDAIMSDFEQGVPWLADKQAAEFEQQYPELTAFFEWLSELEEIE